MKTNDIVKAINEQRTTDINFIGWWRKEEDFIDYDLVDRFISNSLQNQEIGGFELLGTEGMWQRLQSVCGDRVMKTQKGGEQLIEWTVGGERRTLSYTPKSIMDIFDAETKGDVID